MLSVAEFFRLGTIQRIQALRPFIKEDQVVFKRKSYPASPLRHFIGSLSQNDRDLQEAILRYLEDEELHMLWALLDYFQIETFLVDGWIENWQRLAEYFPFGCFGDQGYPRWDHNFNLWLTGYAKSNDKLSVSFFQHSALLDKIEPALVKAEKYTTLGRALNDLIWLRHKSSFEVSRLVNGIDWLQFKIDEQNYPMLFYGFMVQYHPSFSYPDPVKVKRPIWSRQNHCQLDRFFKPAALTTLWVLRYQLKLNKDVTELIIKHLLAVHLDWLVEMMNVVTLRVADRRDEYWQYNPKDIENDVIIDDQDSFNTTKRDYVMTECRDLGLMPGYEYRRAGHDRAWWLRHVFAKADRVITAAKQCDEFKDGQVTEWFIDQIVYFCKDRPGTVTMMKIWRGEVGVPHFKRPY